MPTLSVLLPVRDGAATLDAALTSLTEQTFDDFEILVIDDHSTDSTSDLISKWAMRDVRVRPLSAPKPGGIVAALNEGMAQARGDLIGRMDADDFSLPTRLERQVTFLSTHPEIDVVGCQVEIHCDGEQPAEGYQRYEQWLNACVSPEQIWQQRFVESPLAHPSVVMRRTALERVGGYHDPPWAEDYDLWLRMLAAGSRMAKVPEVLLRWSDAPNRLSRREGRYDQAQFLRCRAHHLARIERVREHGVAIWAAGPIGKTMARLLQAEGITVHRFIDIHPRRVGEMIHGAPVIAPEDETASDEVVHLASAGQPGRREIMRDLLRDKNLREGEDFLCIA